MPTGILAMTAALTISCSGAAMALQPQSELLSAADQIVETIKKEIPDMKTVLVSNMDPVRFEKDCRLVDTLRYTYERVTGMDGTPVTTTGGTYAKMMPNIVPFGPSFPGQKGIGHQPDEWMKVEDIITNAKIYALSLYYLAKDTEMERK